MPTTFSGAKVALDEIATRIQANRKRLDQAKAGTALADTDLTAMTTAYTAIISDINAMLAAEPNNDAIKTLHAEKGKLVAEFQALRTAATSMKDATAAITY